MKVAFFVKLCGSFILGSFFALFICVMSSSGMRTLISPVLMAVFPSIVMGALLCSLVGGQTFIVRSVGFSCRIFALFILCGGFVFFGLQPDMFQDTSVQVVLGGALFGLALGYLMSDWHVSLYRSVYSARVIGVATGAFLLSYYIVYNFFSPYGHAVLVSMENTSFLFLYGCLCIVILFMLSIIEQAFMKDESEGQAVLMVKDFSVIKSKLILISLLAFQSLIFCVLVWGWYVHQSFSNGWLFASDMQDVAQLIFLPSMLLFIIIFTVFLTYVQNNYALYVVQIFSFIISILIVLGLSINSGSLTMRVLFVFMLFAGSGTLMLINYYTLISFKGSLLSIFVPIAVCIYLFCNSIGQVFIPMLPSFRAETMDNVLFASAFMLAFISGLIICYALFNMELLPKEITIGWKYIGKRAKSIFQ